MRRPVIALALAVLLTAAGPAAAQRYEALTTDIERLEQHVDEIRDLIDEVDRARAADPRFVRDARSVLRRYDNPWRVPLAAKDFRDGDFPRNPAWVVDGGENVVHAAVARKTPTAKRRMWTAPIVAPLHPDVSLTRPARG